MFLQMPEGSADSMEGLSYVWYLRFYFEADD